MQDVADSSQETGKHNYNQSSRRAAQGHFSYVLLGWTESLPGPEAHQRASMVGGQSSGLAAKL